MTDSTENTDNTSNAQNEGAAPSDSGSEASTSKAPSSTSSAVAPSSSAGGVNAQILDAVDKSTATVLGSAASAGAATAYQKVAQAAAFAVQDATDYSRNIENITMTAQGVIVAKMLEDQSNIPIYTPVLATLQEMVVAASTNLATVGTTAAAIASEFPATKS